MRIHGLGNPVSQNGRTTTRKGAARRSARRASRDRDVGEKFIAELQEQRRRLKQWIRIISQEARRESLRGGSRAPAHPGRVPPGRDRLLSL